MGEAALVRIATQALQQPNLWAACKASRRVHLYCHLCPCDTCAERIIEFQQLLSKPLTLCVATPWKSHHFEAVSNTSDRMVYLRMRSQGVEVVQLPLSMTWSRKKVERYH